MSRTTSWSLLLVAGRAVVADEPCHSRHQPTATTPPWTQRAPPHRRLKHLQAHHLDTSLAQRLGEQDGGIAVFLTREGTTTSVVAGVANAGRRSNSAADTPFRVGSISKCSSPRWSCNSSMREASTLDEALLTYLPNTPIGGDTPDPHVAQPWQRPARRQRPRVSLHPRRVRGSQPKRPLPTRSWPGWTAPGDRRTRSVLRLLGHQLHPVRPAHPTITGTDADTALRERISEPLALKATRFATVAYRQPRWPRRRRGHPRSPRR